jgi:hypothetical protein
MRCLGLAQRSLNDPQPASADASALNLDLARRINTVHAALVQMSEMVRSTMAGVGPDGRLGRRSGLVELWTLDEALRHAADVMTPLAQESGVVIVLEVHPDAACTRCGSMYAPVVAGGSAAPQGSK